MISPASPLKWYELAFRANMVLVSLLGAVVLLIPPMPAAQRQLPPWLLALAKTAFPLVLAYFSLQNLRGILKRLNGQAIETLPHFAQLRPPYAKCVIMAIAGAVFLAGGILTALQQGGFPGIALVFCVGGLCMLTFGSCGVLWARDLRKERL